MPTVSPVEESQFAVWSKGAILSLFRSLPVRLGRDSLYLWSTFRLRRRPFKMMVLIAFLGAFCWAWQWMGIEWATPRIDDGLDPLEDGFIKSVLTNTSRAVLSSLNLLSCIAILIMARSLRMLLKEGHLEALTLTPTPYRPSALFYAISTRYLPLALVAILVIYTHPTESPFDMQPFVLGPTDNPDILDSWVLYWAGIREESTLLFCVTNLFMDMALAYWLFSRWRITTASTIAAVVVIGLVTPILNMAAFEWVYEYVLEKILLSEGIFDFFVRQFSMPIPHYTEFDMAWTSHYLPMSVISLLIGLMLLTDLEFRWYRILHSAVRDPVMIKQPK